MMTTLVKLLHVIHVFKQYAKQITVETYTCRSMLTVVTQNVALLIFVNLNVNLLGK